jgi:hypothetical protein
MATPQLSPGVLTREVDLTVGRADNVLDNIGAIAGPFKIGPVDFPIDIATEQELIDVFGKPDSLDGQYEYWMSASAYLSYGGVLKVVRTDGDNLINANARRVRNGEVSVASTAGEIVYSGLTNTVGLGTTVRTSGTYRITGAAYTTSGIGTEAIFSVGIGTTNSLVESFIILNGGAGFQLNDTITIQNEDIGGTGIGTTGSIIVTVEDIYTLGGISTVGDNTLKIKNFDDYNQNYADDIASYIFSAKTPGSWANNLKVCFIDDKADQTLKISNSWLQSVNGGNSLVGLAVSVSIVNQVIPNPNGVGNTTFTGTLKSIITGQSEDSIDVKIVSRVDVGTGTTTLVEYSEKNRAASIRDGQTIVVMNNNGVALGSTTLAIDAVEDWYDNQTLNLENSLIYWKSIAPKPTTGRYVAERNGRNDSMHVVIVDDTGDVTGISGNLLEKHLFLSKAIDAVSAVNSPQRIWWKEYLAQYSSYVYVGDNPSDESNNEEVYQTFFEDGVWNVDDGPTKGLWNQAAQDVTFSVMGNATYNLSGGIDYGPENGEIGSLTPSLGDLITSYDLFSNKEEIEVDYLIMGPGLSNFYESQAKASYLISIAESRKDCMAVISPHRWSVVSEPDPSDVQSLRRYLTPNDITNNIIDFYSVLPSSSYAVFDTGYKYTYDRFNNKFRYIPTNGDVAGLMVRTSIFAYPWFSPAGQQRGILNNAIKLAYNPNKAQRDRLYPKRINAIINKPGIGIMLFGDKTALGYASAFDRINVRRLFLTVEQALARTSESVLFELNDDITRANFVNIVEPYLRDVQAKRGLYGYYVVCDSSNNTPDIIDNNEFRADIFLKPAKSINYVTLTFVATRTGVSFEEVVGTV